MMNQLPKPIRNISEPSLEEVLKHLKESYLSVTPIVEIILSRETYNKYKKVLDAYKEYLEDYESTNKTA